MCHFCTSSYIHAEYLYILCRADGPVDVDNFRTLLVENSCEKSEDRLMNGWFPKVTALFSGDKALVSGPQRPQFYGCLATLLTNQVHTHTHYIHYIRVSGYTANKPGPHTHTHTLYTLYTGVWLHC